jgi:putative phosphoribosyl transferase
MGLAQLRFVDRKAAGDILAEILWQTIPKVQRSEIVVLGIPRGGVVVAKQIATKFSAELGLVVAKKILAPQSDEDAIGAVVAGQPDYFDRSALDKLKIEPDAIAASASQAKEEIAIRNQLYPRGSQSSQIKGKTVILVDDGAATGSTLVASARFVRTQNPALLVVAVPVATNVAIGKLEKEADKIVIVVQAKGNFRAVGQFYKSFVPVAHEDALKALGSNKSQTTN